MIYGAVGIVILPSDIQIILVNLESQLPQTNSGIWELPSKF